MNDDVTIIPMPNMKKALIPVLAFGIPIVLVELVVVLPLIVRKFGDKDTDSAISLLLKLIGVLMIVAGMIVTKVSAVKRKRLEFELHSFEPADQFDNL